MDNIAPSSVTRMMLNVFYALIPGIVTYVIFFGWGIVLNILVAIITALVTEIFMLQLRKRPIKPFIMDGSAVITAMLLALALPNLAPWWLTFIGVSFAIIVGKHLYGGLGYNPFNPAMIGYVLLLISFPLEMTVWLQPDSNISFSQNLNYLLHSTLNNIDAMTMATTMDTVKTQSGLGLSFTTIQSNYPTVFGQFAGKGWEWINLMFLLGGLWLLFRRVINWQIPTAFLVSLAIMALIFYPSTDTSPMYHLFSGATMLCAFFIATDPVTASTTPNGRLIYAAGIGIFAYIIRTWGGYPDGIAFGVLLMNMAAPMIDYYTRPKAFGES